MPRRYTRIKQGSYYNTGLNNYVNYLQTAATRERQLGTRPEYNFKPAYVLPFGSDLGGPDELVEGRVQVEHYTALATVINTGTGGQVTDTPGASEVVLFGKFRPARVTWERAATKVKRVETSKVTGLKYLTYDDTERFSCPFGRAGVDDKIYETFLAIKAALKGTGSFAINRVSLQEENIDFTA